SSGSSSGGSTEDIPCAVPPKELVGSVRQKIFLDYSTYMARLVPAQGVGSPDRSPSRGAPGSPTPAKLVASVPPQLGEDGAGRSEACVAWMNALVGRVFWDFLREPYWAEQVSSKIQKKLSKIKLPYFMNELALTELDMGSSIPSVLSASNPTINDRGLWVDMEVTYSGSLQMTLETKMNLCKLGKESAAEESSPAEPGGEGARPRLILLADSDADQGCSPSGTRRPQTHFSWSPPRAGQDLGTQSSRSLKPSGGAARAVPRMWGVMLSAFSIPPRRYSFRVPPRLELKVRPKLGEREVTFLHVTEWIERKLQHEFQKILVMPNMDDLIIPVMRSGLDP
ncbi:Testis-expressed sequence 2 protein, partial [Opisthocomus hoazin]